jgi:hypothetical protein
MMKVGSATSKLSSRTITGIKGKSLRTLNHSYFILHLSRVVFKQQPSYW